MFNPLRNIHKRHQSSLNEQYRKRLKNSDFTLICSNCFGGIFYHWLGLKFNTPFINLWLTNEDFIKAVANWDEFIDHPIVEDKEANMGYPVGISLDGIRIYFQHYKTFDEAIEKWNIRKTRINHSKTVFLLTNWKGDDYTVRNFNSLNVKNKLIFTNRSFEEFDSSVRLKGWKPSSGRNIWATSDLYGNRYIDSFDMITYLNNLKDS